MTTFLTWLLGPRCDRDGCQIRCYPRDRADHDSRYHVPIPVRAKRVRR